MPATNFPLLPNRYRSHTNGELNAKNIGEDVRLSGWVHNRRDHGGLVFIDLRDRWGIVQLTFNPKQDEAAWHTAQKLRSEYAITIEGAVANRPPAQVNKKIPTGEIEVVVRRISVLSTSEALPFDITAEDNVNEEVRLRYRFLDLRRERLQRIMERRDEFITYMRHYMHKLRFVEVQTPILANSSPEGARDFLVPSRLNPGCFYALPQAPQQFKQLLMVSGLERYFQIAPCFRDEDPRADRHPGEFYQLDLEMSFVEQEDIFRVVEPLMVELTQKFSDKKITASPFLRLTWHDAMARYGSDKPDLRFGLPITDVTQDVLKSEFRVFHEAVERGGVAHALHVPGGASFTRQQIDALTEAAKTAGAQGLAYILFKGDGAVSPILKYLSPAVLKAVQKAVGAAAGDALFFGAGEWLQVCRALGVVRSHAADLLKLKDPSQAAWCWVTDFPMYEFNAEEGKVDFSHNPFSMPQGGLDALNQQDPLKILGYQYDLVLNGFEISSGAIRNHDPATMYRAFEIAGYSRRVVDEKFGGMIAAFRFGAPPHGGIAPGIDRLMMVLWDLPNIRDIYAFPKSGRAQDLLMKAPSPVSDKQLRDLRIKLDLPDE